MITRPAQTFAPRQDDTGSDIVDALRTGEGIGLWEWGGAAIIFVAGIIVAQLLKWALHRALVRRLDPALATLLSRFASYVLIVVGFVYSLDSLGVQIAPIIGALGIAGIALAFALQDILENFVAGVLLQLQRPFTYGDQVSINDSEGTVQSIDSRLVTIVTPGGETVKIPSATVIKSDIVNYTQLGRRRTTLPIGVAYGTDLDLARRVLLDAVSSTGGVDDDPAPEVLVEAFGSSSIDLVVRFWHEPSIASFWAVRSDVALAVDKALAGAAITIPFPQQTVWFAGSTDA